jgi:pyruvate/2-oxoglutarate dehydrogenase complex dihydrolipoamide acyltransferase (E2) component
MDLIYNQSETSGNSVVAKWYVAVGAQVNAGDPLVGIETDKVEFDFEAPAAGTLRQILVETGDEISDGDIIGRLEEQ